MPDNTRFTKTPHWQSINSKDEIVEGLRDQKEYWEKQMFGIQADNLNGFDTQDECDKAVERFKRYEQRVRACSIFIQTLIDDTRLEDEEIRPTWDKVEIEASVSKTTEGGGSE